MLTSSALLERRASDFEVVSHHALGTLAAIVRFWGEPQWLSLEWADGSPCTLLSLPARDALLTAILYAAQVTPVLCCSAESWLQDGVVRHLWLWSGQMAAPAHCSACRRETLCSPPPCTLPR